MVDKAELGAPSWFEGKVIPAITVAPNASKNQLSVLWIATIADQELAIRDKAKTFSFPARACLLPYRAQALCEHVSSDSDVLAGLRVEAMPAGLDIEKGVDLILADADPGAEFWQIEIVQTPGLL